MFVSGLGLFLWVCVDNYLHWCQFRVRVGKNGGVEARYSLYIPESEKAVSFFVCERLGNGSNVVEWKLASSSTSIVLTCM